MSEHMFGLMRRKVTKHEAKQLDRICKANGGTGFVGPVDIPGNEVKGWFTSRDQGEPFNSATANAVLDAVASEAGVLL